MVVKSSWKGLKCLCPLRGAQEVVTLGPATVNGGPRRGRQPRRVELWKELPWAPVEGRKQGQPASSYFG